MYLTEMAIVANGFLFVSLMTVYILFQQDFTKKIEDIACIILLIISIMNILFGYLFNSLILCFFAIIWVVLYVKITIEEQRSIHLVATLTLLLLDIAICLSFFAS